MLKLYGLIVAALVLPACIWGQSNEGTLFWFGFMEHVDPLQNTKVVMVTAKTNTSGSISVPLRNWSQSFTVTANEVTLITLPTFTETMGSESISNTGIELHSTAPVSVYIHQYAGSRSEAAAILPVPALGDDYYALTYPGVVNRSVDYPSELLVVAVADNTNIEILLQTNTAKGRSPGEKIQVKLDAGETYQVQGAQAHDDLSGTRVSGDQSFALFAGAVWTEVPTGCAARDNLLEQMYAVATWGKQYVTAPSHGVAFDIFRIMASEDNTTVKVSTGATYQLQAGEFVEYQVSKQSTYVESDKPVLLAQFNIGQTCNDYGIGDPSLVLLNSIEQTRDTVTLFNSRFQDIEENFINIISRTIDIDVIILDDEPIESSEFKPVKGNPAFSYAILKVQSGTHTLISDGCGVLATAYGYGRFESYAYGGGANFVKLNANPIPVGGCLSDTIFFDAGLSPLRYSFLWDLGDGNTSTDAKFTHQYDRLGFYDLTLFTHDQCLDLRDTIYQTLEITLRQGLQAIDDVRICEADTLFLGAEDLTGAHYRWNGPSGFHAERQFPEIPNAGLSLDGVFEVVGIISGCATFPDLVDVEIVPLPKPDLGPDTIVCDFLGQVSLDPGVYPNYLWQNGSTNQNFITDEPGSYWVQVTNEFGCADTSAITLNRRCPSRIYVPNAFTPNGDATNDLFRIYAEDVSSLHWRIFDRWGNLVFEANDLMAGWDGSQAGKRLPTGVYLWSLHYEGYSEHGKMIREVRNGVVHLLR